MMGIQHRLTTEEFAQLRQLYMATPMMEPTGENSPILRELAAIERPLLQQLIHECTADAGELLFREDDAGDAMYVILAGEVAVIKGRFDAPTILGYRGPGEIVGEMALLEHAPRSASVVAMEPLRLLRINRQSLELLLNSKPGIGMNIMATLSARLRNADDVLNVHTQARKQLTQQVAQLRAEKEQLLEIQRVRQEVSDLIVHDLRNPLGIIYSVLDVLKMVLPEEILSNNQELLSIADEARSRMKRLIESLLDIARMEEGQTVLNLRSVSLPHLINRLMKSMDLIAKRRHIALEVIMAETLAPIILDEEKIERVLANLLDNAFKYTSHGGSIVITVTEENAQVRVCVSDTGPGIPESERERIFERFTQVQGDNVARRRGFGLGLAFCKLAVEAHGGAIWVEPGPGGIGSQFIFTLPGAAN